MDTNADIRSFVLFWIFSFAFVQKKISNEQTTSNERISSHIFESNLVEEHVRKLSAQAQSRFADSTAISASSRSGATAASFSDDALAAAAANSGSACAASVAAAFSSGLLLLE